MQVTVIEKHLSNFIVQSHYIRIHDSIYNMQKILLERKSYLWHVIKSHWEFVKGKIKHYRERKQGYVQANAEYVVLNKVGGLCISTAIDTLATRI